VVWIPHLDAQIGKSLSKIILKLGGKSSVDVAAEQGDGSGVGRDVVLNGPALGSVLQNIISLIAYKAAKKARVFVPGKQAWLNL